MELLLAHGADPNGHVDSAGNAVYARSLSELRALLMARGGTLDPYDLVWLDEDDEVMRRVTEDPGSAEVRLRRGIYGRMHAREAAIFCCACWTPASACRRL